MNKLPKYLNTEIQNPVYQRTNKLNIVYNTTINNYETGLEFYIKYSKNDIYGLQVNFMYMFNSH